MGTMRVILNNIRPDDYDLAIRAVRFLQERPETKRDAIVTCDGKRDFYVRRNKASITVRPCGYSHQPDMGTA